MIDEPEEDSQETDAGETEAEVDIDTVPTETPEPDLSVDPDAPTDDKIYHTMANHIYATSYVHKPGSKTNPRVIMKMEVPDLIEFARSAKADIQDIETSEQHGLYANRNYKFLKNLISFITDVVKEKNSK